MHEEPQELSIKWYELSPWLIGWLIISPLLHLWFCLWNPAASDILFLSGWLFLSIHYLLGVMITQFKVKMRSILFLALFTLSLSFILFFGEVHHMFAQFGLVSQVIFATGLMVLTLPFYAAAVYKLIKEYRKSGQTLQSEQTFKTE
ncbi:MAG: hypothetical protein N3F08_00085 [Crenarchaeota archaeon]|nr:hypothetical protein [Thermoproteota archaeon]